MKRANAPLWGSSPIADSCGSSSSGGGAATGARRRTHGVAIFLSLFVFIGSSCGSPSESSNLNPSREEPLTNAKQLLESASLSGELAEKLVTTNARLLTFLYEEDPQSYHEVLVLWARLGSHPELHPQLSIYPEAASLAAGVLDVDPLGAAKIVESLPTDERQRDVVYSMYTFFPEPQGALLIAQRLRHSGSIMVDLWLEGQVYILPYLIRFSGPEAEAAEEVYLQWVDSVFSHALRSSQSERSRNLDNSLALVVCHSDAIKRTLLSEVQFREAFLTKYWPRFQALLMRKLASATNSDQRELIWAEYTGHPSVWQFIHEFASKTSEDAAFQTFERYGCVAVDLWFTPEFRENAVREKLIEVLKAADDQVLGALAASTLRSEPLFFQLIKRNLPSGTLGTALAVLGSNADNPREIQRLLDYWSRLSDQALVEELGSEPGGPVTWIPGYQVYYVLHKQAQGREISAFDMIAAVLDAASFVPIGAGSSKLITISGNRARAAVVEGVANATLKKAIMETAEQTAEKEVTRALPTAIMRETFSVARSDITSGVRLAFQTFKRLGVGREMFRELTGLEPRIFMRRDRYVFLNYGAIVDPHSPFGRFLHETAMNAGADIALSTPAGQTAMKEITQHARNAWRQYLSATWLAVGLRKNVEEGNHGEHR
ncbi:hypothetical protein [Thermogutta sp.]|jgi:hypothetical protein|uniref:hypothetical protein n=1 Tax=Thermogutta sp. TaxID=1962930 RepID=UPI003C7DAF6D